MKKDSAVGDMRGDMRSLRPKSFPLVPTRPPTAKKSRDQGEGTAPAQRSLRFGARLK